MYILINSEANATLVAEHLRGGVCVINNVWRKKEKFEHSICNIIMMCPLCSIQCALFCRSISLTSRYVCISSRSLDFTLVDIQKVRRHNIQRVSQIFVKTSPWLATVTRLCNYKALLHLPQGKVLNAEIEFRARSLK